MKPSCLIKITAFVIAALASAAPAAAQTSGLPVVRIDTKDGAPIPDKENYVNMTFTLTDVDNPKNNITVVNNIDGIRGRGNTTWGHPKKPYRITFDKKQSLFGLPAAKSWVLLAEYLDPTLIKNTVAFELGDRFGLQYNHSYHHVQLYLNGKYLGVYGLTEQNQAGEGRVDIDIDDGWLVELDFHYDEEPKFRTASYDLPILIKSPETEFDSINSFTYDFIRKDINELCDSMASANFPENGYRDLIDMDNFIQYIMVPALIGWSDFYHPGSVFMYKDKGGKISMGPLWDYDIAWGFSWDNVPLYKIMSNGENVPNPGGWWGVPIPGDVFFNRFFQDPEFIVRWKEFWNSKFSEISSIPLFIDNTANKINTGAKENFNIWWTDYPVDFDEQIGIMKDYYNSRTAYLNGEYNKTEVLPASKTFTTQLSGYGEAAAQTFTLVSYGDMTNLSAAFQNAESSAFEISAELDKTPTGRGGYLAAISVKPKDSLAAATYTDALVLSGNNQGKPFSLNVPLRFAVKGAAPAEIVFPVFSEPVVYSPTRKLSDIALRGSGNGIFIWENDSIVPVANISAYNVIFIPNDPEKYDSSKILLNKPVDLTVEKATPSYKLPTALTAVYGASLSSVMLPERWEWESKSGTVGNAGTQTHKARFVPMDLNNYKIIDGVSVTVAVAKAPPIYTVPAGLTAAYGDSLSSVALTKGWSWDETGTVGDVGTRAHTVTFTPMDTANYNVVTGVGVTVAVVKAAPKVAAWPTSDAVTYGAALSASALTGGAANADGSFAWTAGATVPTVTNNGYGVTFTPTDTANYKTASRTVAITVHKADPVVAWPANLGAKAGETLSEVLITGGGGDGTFSWTTPDAVVEKADARQYNMTFTPTDDANYNVMTQDVTVLTGKFTAGPNPVARQSGIVNFYRQGKQVAACELRIYDALGNVINKVNISDSAPGGQPRRLVGSWDFKDARGRLISRGTYLIKGAVNTLDGKSEKISLLLSVR